MLLCFFCIYKKPSYFCKIAINRKVQGSGKPVSNIKYLQKCVVETCKSVNKNYFTETKNLLLYD